MGKSMYELRDKLCDELDKVARKSDIGAGDLELAHKLTDTIKNIDKISIMEEDGGYSQAGDWEARGRFGDQYAREGGEGGNSYAGRRRDSMGRYSRADGMYDDGMSTRRGMSRRGYSRAGDLMDHVDMMMDEAETDEQRDMIRRFKKQLQDVR